MLITQTHTHEVVSLGSIDIFIKGGKMSMITFSKPQTVGNKTVNNNNNNKNKKQK